MISPWRGVVHGFLLATSLGVGALIEFFAGTWMPEPGVGALRIVVWVAIAACLWFSGSILPRPQRALVAIVPVAILASAFASPWPQPRKQFFRDMAELRVGMSETAALSRVAAHHLCDSKESEYWLRYHISHIRDDAAKGLQPKYLVLTPASYNGFIGDSDHCLLVLNGGVVTEVAACVD